MIDTFSPDCSASHGSHLLTGDVPADLQESVAATQAQRDTHATQRDQHVVHRSPAQPVELAHGAATNPQPAAAVSAAPGLTVASNECQAASASEAQEQNASARQVDAACAPTNGTLAIAPPLFVPPAVQPRSRSGTADTHISSADVLPDGLASMSDYALDEFLHGSNVLSDLALPHEHSSFDGMWSTGSPHHYLLPPSASGELDQCDQQTGVSPSTSALPLADGDLNLPSAADHSGASLPSSHAADVMPTADLSQQHLQPHLEQQQQQYRDQHSQELHQPSDQQPGMPERAAGVPPRGMTTRHGADQPVSNAGEVYIRPKRRVKQSQKYAGECCVFGMQHLCCSMRLQPC